MGHHAAATPLLTGIDTTRSDDGGSEHFRSWVTHLETAVSDPNFVLLRDVEQDWHLEPLHERE